MTDRALTFTAHEEKERLDLFLTKNVRELSRSKLCQLIKRGLVRVNGRVVTRQGERICRGDVVEITVPESDVEKYPSGSSLSFTILYEDEYLIAVDKPPGVLVHPTPKSREETLLHAISSKMRGFLGSEAKRPGVIHRIDRPVSGVVLFAKEPQTALLMRESFAAREVEKIYFALIWGRLDEGSLLINKPLRRVTGRRKVTVSNTGRTALTRVEKVCEIGHFTLAKVRILTGRRHQIRAHLEYLGHPIVKDKNYGFKESMLEKAPPPIKSAVDKCPGIFLHAWKIAFTHPVKKEKVELKSPLPVWFDELF